MSHTMKKLFTLGALLVSLTTAAQTDMDRRRYIEQFATLAMNQQQEYGIPASITLAQGILESSSGKSRLAVEANNHFGIKCKEEWTGNKIYHDDDELQECFRSYSSAEESYIDHSIFLTTRSRYAKLFSLDVTDYKGWAHGLKEAGYATNPAYAQSLIKIIEDYNLYDFDTAQPFEKAEPLHKPRRERTAEELAAVGRISFNADAIKAGSPKNPSIPSTMGIDIDNHTVALFSVGDYALRSNNGCRYVVAQEGDSVEKLAALFRISPKRLRKNNDMAPRGAVKGGDIVYLDRKKSSYGKDAVHIAAEGESMWHVSQYYAVRLDKLSQLNKERSGELKADERIILSQTN